MKPFDLHDSQEKDVILGTYSMAAEGMDIPKLNTIILASPKSDIVQAVGRILREKSEHRKFIPHIIDIHDEFSLFKNQSQKRLKYYKKMNYTIDITNLNGITEPILKQTTLNMNQCLC